jgi:hypothetical protein
MELENMMHIKCFNPVIGIVVPIKHCGEVEYRPTILGAMYLESMVHIRR